jgi:hypothetical protein
MRKKLPLKSRPARIVYPEITEDDKPLYANAIQINHTPWDFVLHFSQLIPPTSVPKRQEVEIKGISVARINIPVTLVRGLINALETNISTYETNYGKVEIPREAKKRGDGNGAVQ